MYLFMFACVVCFCKQKTAYELRISDWSSDVCSSDLLLVQLAELLALLALLLRQLLQYLLELFLERGDVSPDLLLMLLGPLAEHLRAHHLAFRDRKSVV